MRKITESDNIQEYWYKEARDITEETLPDFIEKLTTEYEHDYGTIVHAAVAAALAAVNAIDRSAQGGLTGFQASFVSLMFLRNWHGDLKDAPFRIENYSRMLYPQYKDSFCTIPKTVMDWLIKEATNNLAIHEPTEISPAVWKHWESIAEGKVPFGYTIKG